VPTQETTLMRAVVGLASVLWLTACDFGDPELVHTTPRADAGNNVLGELTVEINGQAGLSFLDAHVLERQEIHDGGSTVVGWVLDGRDPPDCSSESATCIALRIELPVAPPLGTYACTQAQVSVSLMYQVVDKFDYTAAPADPCSFAVTETGAGETLRIESFDASWTDLYGSVHATGSAHAPAP
jgi:hypothetical protein